MGAFDDLVPQDKAGVAVAENPFADLLPEAKPVIRDVPHGTLNKNDLVPSIRLIGGETVPGKPGDTHPDIIDRHHLTPKEIDQRGFEDSQGRFYDRETGAKGTQLATKREPGRLHSTDLLDLSPEVTRPPSSPEELAARNFELRRQAARTLGLREPFVPEGEVGPMDVTLPGGMRIRGTEPIGLPQLEAPPQAGALEKIATGAYNVAAGVPNFFLTPEGQVTAMTPGLLGARLARPILGGLFGGLLTKSAAQLAGEASVTGDIQKWTEAALTGAMGAAGPGDIVIRGRLAQIARAKAATRNQLPQAAAEAQKGVLTDARRIREDERQVPTRGVEPQSGARQGRPDLEQPAPGEPGRVAPRPEAQAPQEGQPGLLLKQQERPQKIEAWEESMRALSQFKAKPLTVEEESAARSQLAEELGYEPPKKTPETPAPKAPEPAAPEPAAPAAEAPKAPAAGGKAVPVWKVSYTDLETRAARRPFFKLSVEVEAPTRKAAIEMVQQYHGNPARYGEFRASKAPEGTKPMSMFRWQEPETPKPPAPAAPLPRPVETRLSPSDKAVTPEEKRFRATAEGQKAMASRASRIAVLSQMNEAIRKLNPDEAYDRSLIETIPDSQIDKWMEDLRQTWNKLKAPAAPQTAAAKLPEIQWSKLGAWREVTPEMLNKPATLGKFLTEGARPSSTAPQTQTHRLTALLDVAKNTVDILGTYEHGRGGAMVLNPTGGKRHIALTSLLKQGYKPIASLLTTEPTTAYRQHFNTHQDFLQQVALPAREQAQKIAGYEPPAAVTPAPEARPEASTDPVLQHLQQHPDLDAALKAIRQSPARNRIRAAIQDAIDKIKATQPALTDEQAADIVTQNLWTQSRQTQPRPSQPGGVAPTAARPGVGPAAPKAEVALPREEPPHGVRLDVTTPQEHPLGPITPSTPQTLAWHQILGGELKEAGLGLRRFWRSFSMQQLPKITEADRLTGEAGVRFDASHRVARIKGLEFAETVLEGIRAKGFDLQFGTALVEDNLRSIRQGFQTLARDYAAEGKTEEADAATEAAGKVTTLIGARNSPFRTEAEYQSFLNQSQTQQAIRRHIQLWNEQKDPIYRKANDLDPDVKLETRGLQTGARINLKAVMPDEGTRTTVGVAGRSLLIRQAITRLRRDPFARQAKGSGTSYEGSYREIMANGYEREYPIAAQHAFIKQMIDSGLAKVSLNREFPKGMLVRGETPKAFELKIGPWRNQWLQVPRSLAEEYQNVSGLTPGWNVPGLKPLSDLLTQASVQGFAEGSTHVSNLSTGILTNLGPTANPMLNALIKSAGRADVLYQLPRILIRGFAAKHKEMLDLAEIGAAKTPYSGLLGWFINGIDRGVRLVSADTYRAMARKGWVEDSETGLREFVNQVGQYSKRLQPATIARLRETGVQPFATAMHTFNVQGLRTLGLGPGAKAPSTLAALALRADKAAGIMGFIVLVSAINRMVSGSASGPPGTQLGNVGWVGDDGKLHQFNLARLFGYERGPRATGIQSYAEARRMGLPQATALGAGMRSIGQTGLGYVTGPTTQFVVKGITGKRPGVPMVQEAKVLPPPTTDEMQPLKTQAAANIAIALQQANPAVDAALMAMQGKEVPDILQRQFSRYTPRAGMGPESIKAVPKIMAAKQMADYVDAIAKEARKKPIMQRMSFLQERLAQDDLTPQQHAEALRRLKFKGVLRYP